MIQRLRLVLALFALSVFTPITPGCSTCDLSISTGTLPDGFVGVFYSTHMDSKCGGDFWFLADGNLPPGIGLQQDGELSGNPAVVGTFHFTVAVVDGDTGDEAFKGLALVVHEAS